MEERAFYRCEVCGNIVGIVKDGGGELTCCGQPMDALEANTVDAAKEKHVPVYEKTGNILRVQVGETPHPMMENHYIEWISVEEPDRTQRVILRPGQEPKAAFEGVGDVFKVYAHCNLHGLWRG